MYLIVVKDDNRILEIGKQVDYLDNGYPRLIEKNIAFSNEDVDVYEVQELPDYVEVEKYCYDGENFYENENYVEPELRNSNEHFEKNNINE